MFEKRDFKDRQRATGAKSTLSLRLEQCPQQLNNPFNEYSKFDGKVTPPQREETPSGSSDLPSAPSRVTSAPRPPRR